ncbi:hypothetical protein C6501_11675 [Candidatus Poribacteria bacterium]|nr:MAG: hypothetical protein C6501_11675 [Candidatus Poribacteria bacterium]
MQKVYTPNVKSKLDLCKRDVGWIKGKLEGKQEGSNKILSVLPLCTAVGAAVIALIALLT